MSIWVDKNGWPVPPQLLLGCLILEILYFRGWMQITGEGLVATDGSDSHSPALTPPDDSSLWRAWLWRGIAFPAGLLAFLAVAAAPIDTLSGSLLWVHMIQHLFLLGIIPLLLVAATPLRPLWLGLPVPVRTFLSACARPGIRRVGARVGNWLFQPTLACVLLVAGIWVWHWPPLYDLALTNDLIHDWLEHSTFLAVSLFFWSQVIPSPPLPDRLGYLGRMACIGVAIIQNVMLAAVLGFAQTPLYAPYAHLMLNNGFTALQDQRLGAGIMWTFGDLPFGIAFSVLLHGWLTSQLGEDGQVYLDEKQHA